MVGLSMAITIAICIVAFIWIYLRVGPYLSDFIPAEPPEPTPNVRIGGIPGAFGTPTVVVTEPPEAPATETSPEMTPTPSPTPAPTPTPVWEATHEIAEGAEINFRAGPSTISEVLDVLEPGTPLKFLGEQQQSGGATWMRFQTEDGTEGWIRTLDIEALAPDDDEAE